MRVYTYYWAQSERGYDERFVIAEVHELKVGQDIRGPVHSAVSTDIKDNVILIDDQNVYKYSVKTQTMQVFKGQNIIGL